MLNLKDIAVVLKMKSNLTSLLVLFFLCASLEAESKKENVILRKENEGEILVNSVISALRVYGQHPVMPPEDEFMMVLDRLLSPTEMEVDRTLSFFHALEGKKLTEVMVAIELYYISKNSYERKKRKATEGKTEASPEKVEGGKAKNSVDEK